MYEGSMTGRFASKREPELQRIDRLDMGAVTGRMTCYYANFEELEKRILAHCYPQHIHMAAELFDVPLEDVTDAQRKYAKTFNLMKLYSATPMPEVIKRGYRIPH